MYAWEESFEHKVGELREKEMRKLRTISMLQAIQVSLYEVVPLLVSLAALLLLELPIWGDRGGWRDLADRGGWRDRG